MERSPDAGLQKRNIQVAEGVIQAVPQLEFDSGNGNVYWHKANVARHDRKINMWQRTQAWNNAIGVDWAAMKTAMEKDG